MTDSPIKLTRYERYRLSNELKILEALYPEESQYYAIHREAIESGYEMLYDWHMEHINGEGSTMSSEESREVWDTFSMFDALARSIKRLDKPEYFENHFSKFRGYDGNNESKFMGFAAYTVKRLKRFEYLDIEGIDGWNSHMPIRETYKRMVEVWKSTESSYELSEPQIDQILGAAVHPDNREG